MNTRSRSRTVIAVVVGVVLLAVAGLVYKTAQPAKVRYSAMFADAYPMVAGSNIKVAGVPVGTIAEVVPDNGMARVVMDLNPEVVPMHTDARATIVTQDLLGERFISLERGSPNAPVLPPGSTLAATQTNRVVDLQDVLNAADTPSSAALAALITTSGEGLRDNGQKTSDTIKALAPSMQQADKLVKILNEQNSQLNQLIDNAAPVASAVSSNHGKDLDNLVGSTTTMLSSVAEQQQALRDTLVQLPHTFASARRTLTELAGVADPTADNLAAIRPTTDNLSDISEELMRFADAADPALGSLPPVLNRVRDLLDKARPVAEDLRPAGADVKDITHSFNSLNKTALTHLTDLMELAKGWTVATAGYDGIAHYFKAYAKISPTALGVIATSPIPGPQRSFPILPMPAPPEPPFNKIGEQVQPEGPGDPRTSRPYGSTGGPADNNGNNNGGATGLTPEQEKGMVGQMLGGRMLGGGS